MARFQARLWLARDPGTVIDADIHLLKDRLLVVSGDDVIGDWPKADIRLDSQDDGLHIHAEGEELVVTSDDPGFALALLGQAPASASVGLASRIRSAWIERSIGAERPWWRSWWAITGGVVLLIAFLGSLGSDADPEPTAEPATTTTAATTTTGDTPTTTQPSTTSSTIQPSTTEALPQVPQADLIFAPPLAGASGDPTGEFPPDTQIVTVASIQDGDTLDVMFADGSSDTVRLIGVNSPESGECWSDESSRALASLTPIGGDIGMTIDTTDRDQFDRLLRYLWVGSFSVNEELVRRGAAISRRYPPDTAMASRFETAQVEAQQSQIGLWAPDACGPAADADLEIVGLQYDAPGNDNNNLNEEWIRIRNNGSNLVDMTGWGIRDESASNRYSFPTGFTLAVGEAVTVYSGCGDDFGTDLYWCSVGSAIWNNDGDTAFIIDPNGNTHTAESYAPPTTTTSQTPTTTSTEGGENCDPSYPDVCIPPPPPDLDCGDITFRRFTVVGSDPHGFDGDNDGIGCES